MQAIFEGFYLGRKTYIFGGSFKLKNHLDGGVHFLCPNIFHIYLHLRAHFWGYQVLNLCGKGLYIFYTMPLIYFTRFWCTDFLYTTGLDTRKSRNPHWAEVPKSPYGPGVLKSSLGWGIKSLLATALTFQRRTHTPISTSESGGPDWGVRGLSRVT